MGAVAALAALVLLGVLVPGHGLYAVTGAVAILMIGATIFQPAAIPVLAMPALVVVQRIGGESTNLSFSDFALFAAFWPAVLLGPRPYSKPMRSLLWLSAIYQLTTLFTVVANPYKANTIEWFHAWLSVAGAIIVGWVIGRSGQARVALTLFLVCCAAIAVLTVIQWVGQLAQGDTGPVYLHVPYEMNKNFVGNLLAFAAVAAYARPPWLRWSPWLTRAAFWLCTAAVVGSQARQALIGLGVALVFLCLRRSSGVKHSRWILLGLVPAAYYVGTLLAEQITSGNQFNSTYQRLTWYQEALSVWTSHQWFGVGLRWWTAGRTQYGFQPPNAELEVLTSAGTVGLVGFLILMVGAVVILWRVNPVYGSLGVAVVGMRLVEGQFDLFWVSVQVSVPFAIAGICLGALVHDDPARGGGGGLGEITTDGGPRTRASASASRQTCTDIEDAVTP